ncbi:hypothetical protein RAB80_008934 [Fusarium oxysporum f. sp. vasinfectum]|nr:hypothetical protein RAB80_008934 [Fusarium oxysporum f. sp. vasinfectum]
MSFKVAATLAGAFASVALAHGTVTGIKVDGTYQPGYDLSSYYKAQQGGEIPSIAAWSAENLDNGFVPPSDYGTSDIACHKKAAPGTSSLSVKAGGTVEFQWSAWPESHIGPVLTYPVVPDTPSNGTISTPAPAAPTPVAPTPVTPTSLVTSVAAAATQAAEVPSTEVPSTEVPVAEEQDTEDGALPKTFTLDTFIDWLRSKNGGSKKARRHARQF